MCKRSTELGKCLQVPALPNKPQAIWYDHCQYLTFPEVQMMSEGPKLNTDLYHSRWWALLVLLCLLACKIIFSTTSILPRKLELTRQLFLCISVQLLLGCRTAQIGRLTQKPVTRWTRQPSFWKKKTLKKLFILYVKCKLWPNIDNRLF